MEPLICVTGANGLIGQKTVLALAGAGYGVLACSKSASKYDLPSNVRWEQFHLADDGKWKSILNASHPSTIINTAAITSVDYAEENKDETWEVNVKAVETIIRECMARDIRLVHYSTDFVFDGEKGMYSETDLPNPLSYYGKSKLESENIALTVPEAIVVRTVLVYGVLESMSRSNFVLWVKESLEKKKAISVTADQFRTPTLVDDLASATLKLLTSNNFSGILHLSGPEYLSVYDFAKKIAQQFGLDSSLVTPVQTLGFGQTGQRPLNTGFDISLARKLIGYAPVGISEGLHLVEKQMRAMNLQPGLG